MIRSISNPSAAPARLNQRLDAKCTIINSDHTFRVASVPQYATRRAAANHLPCQPIVGKIVCKALDCRSAVSCQMFDHHSLTCLRSAYHLHDGPARWCVQATAEEFSDGVPIKHLVFLKKTLKKLSVSNVTQNRP